VSDIYCPKCGEGCDMWEFDTAAERKKYTTQGCAAVGFYECEPNPNRSALVAAVAEIMGDDLDGMANMMEDAEAMGLM